MISHYVVCEQGETEEGKYLAEFEALELAVDFAETYRRKNPEKLLEIRGVTYNRSDLQMGQPLSTWGAVPEAYREDEDSAYENAAEEIIEDARKARAGKKGSGRGRFGIRRKNQGAGQDSSR